MAAVQLTRTHRTLIGVVIAGALIIAGIGFAGSYAAVRELAQQKGFGTFSYFFPIGIDAGICVLLTLDLLLTWLRIPFPLLRQTAWVLTTATITFNGAAAWPDPLGVGMHAVIPVLFVVAVEAARHAVGRIAEITADKHMEGVRLTRWLLAPAPTFLMWRRMKLWEIRSYEQAVLLEQHRLVYEAQLQAQYGRGWRRKAPVEVLIPLRLARYGVPLATSAPHVLEAAGLEVHSPVTVGPPVDQLTVDEHQHALEPDRSESARDKEYETEEGLDTQRRTVFPDSVEGDESTNEAVAEPPSVTAELTDDRSPVTEGAGALPGGGEALGRHGAADPHPFFEPAPPQSSSASAAPLADETPPGEPALASTAEAVVGYQADGGVVEQKPSVPSPRSAEASVEPALWEATVAELGQATARVPEQQTDDQELDPVQQQIVTVAEWLRESEETGQRLSGAEVARRLGLSPRTGQRRLDKAAEHLADQQRQHGRARLRSV
ncbi:hypothetical protein AMK27_36080 [Streptomyces sp. CB02009]|uniref:DUF2637 domain-containing protein n=1 Tax=Streptomyces sp. CB02009 TaxID=1703938 RepID=UPI00093C3DCB|nr:DUF2637 domain-containing protein [Streptomyces sp. CB02009]OKJ49492.1 hypothetical protein AMK27_36080 [Streptomyces sp. CB02009]